MLTTNLAVTLVANHVHRPRRVDGSFQLPEGVPEGDSFNTPRCPAHLECIAKSNACSTNGVVRGRRPCTVAMHSAFGLLTLRAVSQARSPHDPGVQCFSGSSLPVSCDDEHII